MRPAVVQRAGEPLVIRPDVADASAPNGWTEEVRETPRRSAAFDEVLRGTVPARFVFDLVCG
jgi:hypothetical protein